MYLWIGLGFSIEDENTVREYCKKINTEYKVNEQSFTFPQHISLKQSFMTDKYNEIINDLKSYFQNSNEMKINISSVGTIPGVIWLEISEDPILRKYHNDILKILKDNYQVDGIGFDGDNFKFHSTLFQNVDNKDTIEKLFNSIDKQLFENKKIVANKICFGLSKIGKVGTFKLVDEIKL